MLTQVYKLMFFWCIFGYGFRERFGSLFGAVLESKIDENYIKIWLDVSLIFGWILGGF